MVLCEGIKLAIFMSKKTEVSCQTNHWFTSVFLVNSKRKGTKEKMKKNKLVLLSAILAMTLMFGACFSTASAAEDNIFRYAVAFPNMTTLDVHKSTTTDVILPANAIVEPLLDITESGEIVPLLLETLPTTDDGVLFTCKLKQGVKWHDGSELTSADIEFTFNRIFDPLTGNVNVWLCDMIKGGQDMLDGKTDALEGFKVIDEYTFTIELDYAYAPFLSVLATEMMVMYPKAACEAAGDAWGVSTFVGTGPFEFVELMGADYMEAKRFDDYHGEVAKIDGLFIYNMEKGTALLEFETGGVDMVRVDPEMIAPYETGEFADNVTRVDLMAIITMNLNVDMAPLDNVKVREAITYAVDREALVNGYLQGRAHATNSLIPPGILGYPEDRAISTYNPERAKELLAEAGYPDGITLENYVSETAEVANVAVVLQEQLKASGITMNVNKVDGPSYTDMRRAGSVQIPFLTWYKDIADPDNFTYTFYFSGNSKFFSSGWNDAKTDELLTKGRSVAQEERLAVYQEAEAYMLQEQFMAVPLYNPVHYYLIADGVEGVKFDDSMISFGNISK